MPSSLRQCKYQICIISMTLSLMRANISYKVVRFFGNTPTNLRSPDLGRNLKMVSNPCHIHMLCAKGGSASFHNECIVVVHGRQNRTTPDHGIQVLVGVER